MHQNVLDQILLLCLVYLFIGGFHLPLDVLVQLHSQLLCITSILGNLLELLLSLLFSVHVLHGYSETSSVTFRMLLWLSHPFGVLRDQITEFNVAVVLVGTWCCQRLVVYFWRQISWHCCRVFDLHFVIYRGLNLLSLLQQKPSGFWSSRHGSCKRRDCCGTTWVTGLSPLTLAFHEARILIFNVV